MKTRLIALLLTLASSMASANFSVEVRPNAVRNGAGTNYLPSFEDRPASIDVEVFSNGIRQNSTLQIEYTTMGSTKLLWIPIEAASNIGYNLPDLRSAIVSSFTSGETENTTLVIKGGEYSDREIIAVESFELKTVATAPGPVQCSSDSE